MIVLGGVNMRHQASQTFKDWLVQGGPATSIPGYDLFALIFGIVTMGMAYRFIWGSDTFSSTETAVAIVGAIIAAFCSYKSHTAVR